ncbi:hypothetical protein [Labedella endophytica]|jgi:hypothetical protein|uniref:DUF4190 domain-containing protein n=1 Tax=Labedella endophytica TaxID=1523160 RepID=A0A3S1CPZ8_9MICO|nr:hypothetical protein [Labedella endophytica]RUQ98183.1 hypothetical protein ELQ94_14275 [Labedella endophytica]
MSIGQSNLQNDIAKLDEPGIGLALIGLVLSVVIPPLGLIVSVSSYRTAKRSGGPGTVAWWGIWIGAIFTAMLAFVMIASLIGGLLAR